MRVVFTSDLHGRSTLYAQLTALVEAERPDVLILGGDMHPDCDPLNPLGTQAAFAERKLGGLLDTWRSGQPRLEVLCILGNHDAACTQTALETHERAGRLVLLDHRRVRTCGGLDWIGLSHAPPSPFWIKDFERLDQPGDPIPRFDGAVWDGSVGRFREVTADEHFRREPTLADLLRDVPVPSGRWIFVCHPPPFETKLDRLPSVSAPIGSRAVRNFIARSGPICALHGHVHESPEVTGSYVDRVGPSLCVNPGQGHERLHAVVFETEDVDGTMRHTVFG